MDIVFKEKKGETYKVIGIYAKRARGLMVNYIIRNRLTSKELLKDFLMRVIVLIKSSLQARLGFTLEIKTMLFERLLKVQSI